LRFGATAVINSTDGKAVAALMALTAQRGVDTAIEAVGIPATHGTKVDLHLESLWDRNLSITTRLVDTVSTPMLLNAVGVHKINPTKLITHRFKFGQILEAYQTFESAAKTRALKAIIQV
jgi:alcohol dehydrogenase